MPSKNKWGFIILLFAGAKISSLNYFMGIKISGKFYEKYWHESTG